MSLLPEEEAATLKLHTHGKKFGDKKRGGFVSSIDSSRWMLNDTIISSIFCLNLSFNSSTNRVDCHINSEEHLCIIIGKRVDCGV